MEANNLKSQNSKPFIVRQNSSGQEKYGGFLIDLIEELSKAANVSKTLYIFGSDRSSGNAFLSVPSSVRIKVNCRALNIHISGVK